MKYFIDHKKIRYHHIVTLTHTKSDTYELFVWISIDFHTVLYLLNMKLTDYTYHANLLCKKNT